MDSRGGGKSVVNRKGARARDDTRACVPARSYTTGNIVRSREKMSKTSDSSLLSEWTGSSAKCTVKRKEIDPVI